MTIRVPATAQVHKDVTFQGNAVVEDFCLIGYPEQVDVPSRRGIIGGNAYTLSHSIIYPGAPLGRTS